VLVGILFFYFFVDAWLLLVRFVDCRRIEIVGVPGVSDCSLFVCVDARAMLYQLDWDFSSLVIIHGPFLILFCIM
jgi:hypothetical protein